MNADGTQRRRVTRSHGASDFDPSWSPDGTRIVFRTDRGHDRRDPKGSGAEGIFVVDLRSGRETEIQPRSGGLFPAWSPKGSWIAFTGLVPRGESIFLVKPNGRGLRNLHLQTRAGECATWSPDGTRIAFCGHNGDGNWAVWAMNSDGSQQRQLTHPELVQPAGTGGDYPCVWSPDGTKILYSSGQHESRELYAIAADGSGAPQRLTNWNGADAASAWLPDGHIVFAHYTDDAPLPRWYVMNADGSDIHSLPQLAGAGDPIDWLPR
jgi:TolB protein